MKRIIKDILEEEVVFVISLLLAIITSFASKPSLGAINWMVILLLFDLMLMSQAFEKYHLLDSIAMKLLSRVKSQRGIGFVMILITAFLGMLMTNDVALITIVPITIIMSKKAGFNPFKIIILETAAANIGSSLTPFGNPQNLYLYSYYNINAQEFLRTTGPLVTIGLALLILINLGNSKEVMNFTTNNVALKDMKRVVLYIFLFMLVILSVLRIIDYLIVSVIVMIFVVLLDGKLVYKVDYFLLGTFICFFIFIDNVTRLELIHRFTQGLLNSQMMAFSTSAILSQVISNVPSAIMLSGFSGQSKAIILGVSVGGLGTLIASLANLISYKFYVQNYDKKEYAVYFHKLNFALLTVLSLFVVFSEKFIS